MKAAKLARELRRIARREVPTGEPNLWPAIRRQIVSRTPTTNSFPPSGDPSRSTRARRADLASEYVWQSDERRRFGTTSRVLMGGIALVLLVAVLAVVLRNQQGDDRSVGTIGTPASSPTAGSSTPYPNTLLTWPSDGLLTLGVVPAGFIMGGTINAQILPSGDLRISYNPETARDVLIWHVVSVSCKARQFDGDDIVPPFVQPGGPPAVVPAEKTHQPINMVGFTQQDGGPVICASIPAVPAGFVASYARAKGVPQTCPVTLPSQPLFTPPPGQSADPAEGDGDYWYGTNDLWTGLSLDGVWPGEQKVFWWSKSYNVSAEPLPALEVTAKRLDGDAPPATVDRATNGAGAMLDVITFPTSGCWQITGQYKGHSLSFVVWVRAETQAETPPTAIATPIPSLAACPAEQVLSRFIGAFNANDQATLTAMLPVQAISGNPWLAAVAGGTANASNPVIDIVTPTRTDFLTYVATRHQQHETLRLDTLLDTHGSWLPNTVTIVSDLYRQADDVSRQPVQVVAIISCDQQQIDSWSLGAPVDSNTASPLTGDQLIEDTLRQRSLSPRINDDLTAGSCPAMTPQSVNPALSPALGGGPLYVVMGDADSNGVFHLSSSNEVGGWYSFKAVWTSDPSYQGPVLVRGLQVGSTNVMRFGDNNPPDPNLYFTAPHGNEFEVTSTRVNAPGCYAYQVDGIDFSEVIVINVQP